MLFELEHKRKKNPHYINNVIINLHGTIGRKKDLIEKEVTGEGSKGDLCIKKSNKFTRFHSLPYIVISTVYKTMRLPTVNTSRVSENR